MINVEDAIFNPTKFFKRPSDVLKDDSLSRNDKINILRSWAYDEVNKQVAEEENMQSKRKPSNRLTEVSNALEELGADVEKRPGPNKQGG